MNTQDRYPRAVYLIQVATNEPAGTGAIADRPDMSPASVNEMIGNLEAEGLADHEKHEGVPLTDAGIERARESENYMRAHARRFGMTDLEEDVAHFPIPDILPGFSFFDLEPSMESGRRREDAVQRKADHHEEILKLVIGTDRYERATVAPTLIKTLIKALFDEEYGRENGLYRASTDYFAHRSSNTSSTSFGRPDHRRRTSAMPRG